MAQTKGKEIDFVAQQANLTSQIERERLAATKWWEDHGPCYMESAKPEDFTLSHRIKQLEKKLQTPAFQQAKLMTTSAAYGARPPFKECRERKI
ncbi:unnamed protein product [Albugo candida]|uniref:Uncharacterized protein n=1 Tax=Albugo candida TaxID=65357 RepID=A0A024GGI3_9STRA|nr:unnamed protein product [Albugo candida]|eukprot:CCI45869.1 unnamed protein product [Albugo candida]